LRLHHTIFAAMAFIALLLTAQPTSAETAMEKTGIDSMLGLAPTGADVLTEIHQFDLFEQGADETAQTRGDEALKQFSSDHADAAEKEDKQLEALQKKAGLSVAFPEDPSVTVSNRLAGLQGSVGPSYVRKYYEAQAAEYDSALAVLRRYLEKPDSEAIKSFVEKQIPAFEASQQAVVETSKRVSR